MTHSKYAYQIILIKTNPRFPNPLFPRIILFRFGSHKFMSDDQKRQLQKQLWNIADELRGKMDADEFRDYILGFIFYKYLSEKMLIYADQLLKRDNITYDHVDEKSEKGKKIREVIKEEAVDRLGYFLKPSELFHHVAEH